ncbi:MAG: glycosyltransferase [Bacilli bacterium]
MRIGIFTEVYTPTIDILSKETEILKNTLLGLGHEVIIITRGKSFSFQDNILSLPLRNFGRFFPSSIYSAIHFKCFKEIKKLNLDLVHLQEDSSICLLGEQLSVYLQLPLVFTFNPEFYRMPISGTLLQRKIFGKSWRTSIPRIIEKHGQIITKCNYDVLTLRNEGILDSLCMINFSDNDLPEEITYAYQSAIKSNF